MIFPSSAVQVVQDSADQLRILFPPNYTTGRLWLIVAAVWFVLAKLIAPREWKVPLIVTALCLLPAIMLLTSFEIVLLSRTEGTLKMDTRTVFYHSRQSLPLKSIQQAVVATDESGGHLLSVVTASGQEFHMDLGWMQRDGYYQAASAINSFLAGHPEASDALPGLPRLPDFARKALANSARKHPIASDLAAEQSKSH